MAKQFLCPAEQADLAPAWRVARWFNAPDGLDLAGLRGRVVALHAFQMLCPGCVAHGIPQAQRIQASFPATEVAVVGLHTVFEHHQAMTPVSLAAFLYEYRISFPVGVDMPAEDDLIPQTMQRYALRGTPSLVLIDRCGRVRSHAFGRPDDMAVGAAIASLIAEPAPAVRGQTDTVAADNSAVAACTAAGCAISAPEPQ